LFNKQQ